ncbi:gas vesicle protein U [Lysinibacillus capsici]|uniref:Gas vesicle protein U n=1 Tax=Lysinibacillus capsici TaxID=2115968 RepID=A0A2X0Z7A1_9BACI|nr:gas vesicle accessory protein GvpU [Lysinibacillus capsici]SPT98441.1 gas vesicle protein U [Lysinibacillus capsici]
MIENDVILESVISTIDKVDAFTMEITLNVKGIVITGALISRSTYLKGVASDFEGNGEIGNVFSDMFTKLIELKKEHTENADDKDKTVYGVHLKNAQIFDGESVHELGYWRGKLSSVDGFSFGKMEPR